MALRTEEIRNDRPRASPQGLAFAIEHWVEGQRQFFERAARRDNRLGRTMKTIANASFAAGILLAVGALVFELSPFFGNLPKDTRFWEILIGTIVGLPAIGGALAWIVTALASGIIGLLIGGAIALALHRLHAARAH